MRPGRDFRFQKTDFKGAGLRPDPTGFRFQISDPSAKQADVASPLQMSECRIQIPGAKKYRFEGPRRKPDNIGQIPIKNLLSPVLAKVYRAHAYRCDMAGYKVTRRHGTRV